MYKTKAMIHSLKSTDEVIILHETSNNDVVAEYKGIRCKAIYNPFSGLFYVDDLYGELPDQYMCPHCKAYIK